MKGIVFTTFNDMVEGEFGIDVWESVLAAAAPESDGIYTAVEDFPDEELMGMVSALSEQLDTPQEVLIEAFGRYLFGALNSKHPMFVAKETDYFSFLKSIDDVIHKEVEKLYENPNLPSMRWEQTEDDELTLHYRSPRKLCILAIGLIHGAADHYGVRINVKHNPCMHDGSDYCGFVIRKLYD